MDNNLNPGDSTPLLGINKKETILFTQGKKCTAQLKKNT